MIKIYVEIWYYCDVWLSALLRYISCT